MQLLAAWSVTALTVSSGGGHGRNGGGITSAPVAEDDNYTVLHDRELTVDGPGVLANDFDPASGTLQTELVSEPSNGSFVFQDAIFPGGGAFRYVPRVGFVGTDSFTYRVNNGQAQSEVATVTISVTNAAPVASPDAFTVTEDGVLQGSVVLNDLEPNNDPKTAQLVSGPANGTLVLRDDGTFTYIPNPNYSGPDSFRYSITDGIVSTLPVTVSLTVQSTGPFDLDGRDATIASPWMSEPDEAQYGLGVGPGSSAQIILRVHDVPPTYVIESRRVSWNPNVLAVNGITQPGYIDLPTGGGNEVMSVSALVEGFSPTEITYTVSGRVLGGKVGDFAFEAVMQAKERKAVLKSIQFTTDHDVILNNTTNVLTDGVRYDAIEFVREPKYSAPITHTRGERVGVRVTLNTAGLPAGSQYIIVGTSNETGLTFSYGPAAVQNGEFYVNITASSPLGTDIRKISTSIGWTFVLNPGQPNEQRIGMGNSEHKIFTTFGTPKSPGALDALKPTTIRMERMVDTMNPALENARRNAVPPASNPTPQRIVYEATRLHVFRLTGEGSAPVGPTDPQSWTSRAWKVPDTYTDPNPALRGTDCFSGATYYFLVANVAGIDGTISRKAYRAKSLAEPNVALESWTPIDQRVSPTRVEVLGHFDGGDNFNQFETAVVHTVGANTYYFPVGTSRRFKNDANKVITGVFSYLQWARKLDGGQWQRIPPVEHRYTPLAVPDDIID